MGITSYAQNFEDVLLNRVFAGLNYGFYVDIGAYHPVEDSVTKAFYDRGWSGINIEPGETFQQLAAGRPRDLNLHMAVHDRSGEISFVQHHGWYAGLSHVQEDGLANDAFSDRKASRELRTVPCDTLTNILNTHARRQPIAFLKIDAEGSEAAIIRSTDWRMVRPLVLVIEATAPLSTQLDNEEWEPVLLEQGYVRAYFDGINCFYVPEERTDLLRHFELPVNVLDGFRRPEPAEFSACREELRAARERDQKLSAQLERAILERTSVQEQNVALQEQNVALSEQNTVYTTLIQAHVERWNRLVQELRWPDGPRAVRAVLPLARIFRRLKGTELLPKQASQTESSHRQPFAGASSIEPNGTGSSARNARAKASRSTTDTFSAPTISVPTQPSDVIASDAPPMHFDALYGRNITSPDQAALTPLDAAVRRRSLTRRIALLCYRPVRPLIRPIAWRTRAFVTAELRLQLALLNTRLEHLGDTQSRETAEGLAALHSELARFGKMLETTLLTLALEGACPRGEGASCS